MATDPSPYDADDTLSAPRVRALIADDTALVATIAWHPDRTRIGEQAAVMPARDGAWSLDRYAPLFYRAGRGDGAPLAHRSVSRQSIRVRVIDGESLVIAPPAGSAGHHALDGVAIEGEVVVDADALRGVAFLRIGEHVLLALHRQGIAPPVTTDYGLVGVGGAIARVREQIRQVARSTMPVLLLGESGTGKELVAQAIHAHSRRHAGPLVCVNMAAMSESLAAAELFGTTRGAYTGAQQSRRGLFAEAHDGTLFLDEIGDTPPSVQPMLLRTLETGEFRALGAARGERADVRLVAATDRDLGAGFNQPLLRRIEAYTLRLPPLRERREDIGVLVAHFVAREEAQHASTIELDARTIDRLARAPWPGNVRQLGHAIRRLALAPAAELAMTLAEVLRDVSRVSTVSVVSDKVAGESPVPRERRAEDRASPAPAASRAPASRRPRERHRDPSVISDDDVYDALAASDWCVRHAAERLQLSRTSFYALLERSRRVRRIDDIPLDEIRDALTRAPGEPLRWAQQLHVPLESLRRRIRSLGLLPR